MAKKFQKLHESGAHIYTDKQAFKKNLFTGYILFVIGNDFYDQAIKIGTGSPLTHVGMLYYDERTDKWLVLEAQANVNVRIGSLDHYLDNKDCSLIVANHKDWNYDKMTGVFKTGFGYLDYEYDYKEILEIICHIIDPNFVVTPDCNKFICSELVVSVLVQNGFAMDKVTGGNTPASVGADSHLQWVCGWEKKKG